MSNDERPSVTIAPDDEDRRADAIHTAIEVMCLLGLVVIALRIWLL